MNEQILLSEQSHCIYIICKDYLFVDDKLKYVGNAEEICRNELLCGFICEPNGGGFKQYYPVKSKRIVNAQDSFTSLLTSLNIELSSEWKIFKQIK